MTVYPVIMCGGAGVRLWPTSRPDQPKPFARLVGDVSSFQDTVARVAPLGSCIIVGGLSHAGLIESQMLALGIAGHVILEPAARDSAAAMAAAALAVLKEDPAGIMVVVSADHYVPDAAAFRAAVTEAVAASRIGRIVTLGVRPTGPSTAYGYIQAAPGPGIHAIQAFVEKPDEVRAADYVKAGYLWNSGNFVVPARTLVDELERFVPDLLSAVRAAMESGQSAGRAFVLGAPFLEAPKISIDYAVMEQTARALVLPVAFTWADVGSWDAVLGLSPRDDDGNSLQGNVVALDTAGTLIRASEGVQVMALGLTDLAIIAEAGKVLVCDLGSAQSVKAGYDLIRARPVSTLASLTEASTWYDRWLRTAALPLWWTLGADHEVGGFVEGLTPEGHPVRAHRRGRVQGRMIYSFAMAGQLGWQGPWKPAARHALDFMLETFSRPDGLVRALVSEDGTALDSNPAVYDQAFALLGLATLHKVDPDWTDLPGLAARIRHGLEKVRHPSGGFRETGDHPFQANCHMHLLEAALAWEEAGESAWAPLSDEIAQLALGAFIDHRGVLSEFFDETWDRAPGDDGRLVEPGHQFEWAGLLDRWGRRRGRSDAQLAARALYETGRAGVDANRGCAMNALWDDLSLRDGYARLWPQTEYLKAALMLGEPEDALGAANCLKSYLETPVLGAWRDKMRPDGTFIDEAAPVTSLYHIVEACRVLFEISPPASN